MVARGHVKNGVVVLEGGVRLPEGLEVTVTAADASASNTSDLPHSILDIPTISVGVTRKPVSGDDDLLEEMLEGRKI